MDPSRKQVLKHPLPLDIDTWRSAHVDHNNWDDWCASIIANGKAWQYLKPFLRLHGYELYIPITPKVNSKYGPAPLDGRPNESLGHPYTHFHLYHCIRAARDKFGQDVVIRVVSGPEPSDELKVLKRLTSPKLLSDPRNITIPILEWLEFGGLTFIVMPRWDLAFWNHFHKVSEIIELVRVLFCYLDFLHENRIVHMDLHTHNMGINAIPNRRRMNVPGLRDPSTTRYAVFDFGASLIYPYETDLSEATHIQEDYSWERHGLRPETGSFNPFLADVGALGFIVNHYFKDIVAVVPEMARFFRAVSTLDPSHRPTAKAAFQMFEDIRLGMTKEQLDAPRPP